MRWRTVDGSPLGAKTVACVMAVVALALAFLAPRSVLADEETHHYKFGEVVNLWQNKIGPYHNPQETYRFDKMPLCHGAAIPELQQIKYGTFGLGARRSLD